MPQKNARKDNSAQKLQLSGKRKIPVSGKLAKASYEPEPAITNMMMDARYLRQSSALIQDALQRGFDVLQLANGDIVTTGTKTIVYQYSWDDSRGKLARIKVTESGGNMRKSGKGDVDADMMEDAEA